MPVEPHVGHRCCADNGAPHGLLHGRKHLALLHKTDLGLLRVHVDIHLGWVDVDQDHGQRIAAHGQQCMVRLDDCVGQAAVFDIPPVDKQFDRAAGGARQAGQADIAADLDPRRRIRRHTLAPKIHIQRQCVQRSSVAVHPCRQTDHLQGLLAAIDQDQYIEQLPAAGRLKDQPPFVDKAQTALWVGQGIALDNIGDLSGFCSGAAQKFLACRHIKKQMFDRDGRSDRRAGASRRQQSAALDAQAGSKGLAACAAGQSDLAHSRDAVQRFPTKAKGGNLVEVFGRDQFARRVAFKGQRQLLDRNPRPVVGHTKQPAPPFAHFDPNFGRTRIDAVFQQLFGHIGRSLNDLACGDLGGNIGCKELDRHGESCSISNRCQSGHRQLQAQNGLRSLC